MWLDTEFYWNTLIKHTLVDKVEVLIWVHMLPLLYGFMLCIMVQYEEGQPNVYRCNTTFSLIVVLLSNWLSVSCITMYKYTNLNQSQTLQIVWYRWPSFKLFIYLNVLLICLLWSLFYIEMSYVLLWVLARACMVIRTFLVWLSWSCRWASLHIAVSSYSVPLCTL